MDAPMPQTPVSVRWRAAVSRAAREVLAARWRSTLEALDQARADYARARRAGAIDVRALRRAAQRIYDLEQLRSVLAHDLPAPR
jgi:hypothetical protein